jgi:hypothetical protein
VGGISCERIGKHVYLSVRRHRQHMSFGHRRLVQSFARWPGRRQRKQGVLGQEWTLRREGDVSRVQLARHRKTRAARGYLWSVEPHILQGRGRAACTHSRDMWPQPPQLKQLRRENVRTTSVEGGGENKDSGGWRGGGGGAHARRAGGQAHVIDASASSKYRMVR